MNVQKWFDKRGLKFIIQRAAVLLNRYRITPAKAIARIENNLVTLARYGCSPTYFVPGIVLKRHARFIQSLQAKGAEIAVHSYQHLDLKSMRLVEAQEQLNKAINTFVNHAIEVYGFRCPYLSWSEELLASLAEGLFGYSSNQSIWLDITKQDLNNTKSLLFNTLRQFYNPKSFVEIISVPWSLANMVEIPVCIPDDLQLHDGLNLSSDGISEAWIEMLRQTHQRGELFNLIYHPELGSACNLSFEALLKETSLLKPGVWTARLRDIYDWWREKSGFKVDISTIPTGIKLHFNCTPRATILVRGIDIPISEEVWDGSYYQWKSNTLEIPAYPRPFIGLASTVPQHIVSFLNEQGYILDKSVGAIHCGIYIDTAILREYTTQVQLINHIEKSQAPLLRYWRWPMGAKSALSITGDLDSLSLLDYATRLFTS